MFDRKTWSQTVKAKIYSSTEVFSKTPVSNKILKEIREKAKKRNRQYIIIFTFFSILMGFLIILFGQNLIEQENSSKSNQSLKQQEIMEKQYLYFIIDGDKWFENKNWYNAIFQYEKAVELYPEDFDANYRLALAFSYNCVNNKKNCTEGLSLTEKLLKLQPDDKNLLYLRNLY